MPNRKLTTEAFVEKAKKIHGDYYDYGNTIYHETRKPVLITCPVHGDFEQRAYSHIQGNGCKKCKDDQRRMTTEQFIEKARKVHGKRYDYSRTIYLSSHERVIIGCAIHGLFEQTAYLHLQNRNCRACKYLNHPGGYTYGLFAQNPSLAKRAGIFYIVEYKFPDEHFIKIGITQHNAYTRHKSHWSNVEILSEYRLPLADAFHKEQVLLHRPDMQEHRYTPKNLQAGVTECFTLEAKELLF